MISTLKTVCLKALITRVLPGLIAGAHANCKQAEFSTGNGERAKDR